MEALVQLGETTRHYFIDIYVRPIRSREHNRLACKTFLDYLTNVNSLELSLSVLTCAKVGVSHLNLFRVLRTGRAGSSHRSA